MADRQQPNRNRKTTSEGTEPGVLGGLSSTRPARMGRPRHDAATTSARTTAAKSKTAKPRAAKPKPEPVPVKAGTQPHRPRPVRAGHPGLGTAPTKRGRAGQVATPEAGTGVVTTVVQAAGELASIGLTLGGQLLKRAGQKLPRP